MLSRQVPFQHLLARLEHRDNRSPQCWLLLPCRCDEQTAEKLKTPFGHCDGAAHVCNLELETHVTRLGEQLQSLGCNGKTLGTPEEVSMALRSQVLRLEGESCWAWEGSR